MKTLTVEPLTKENFQPFGDVIEMEPQQAVDMNRGMATRYPALSTVDLLGDDDQAVIGLVTSQQYQLPHEIDMVERHPLGSQAFIPLDHHPFIVIVAQATDDFDVSQLRAFKTNGAQGINYNPGTWHAPLFTPYSAMNFAVIDRSGEGQNCDEIYINDEDQSRIE